MQVIVLRHGVAEESGPDGPPDVDRALTKKGALRARDAARGLRALGAKPAVILTSPALRARETAEIASRALGVSRESIRETPALALGAGVADVVSELGALALEGVGSVLVVGHAPHLDDLVAALVGSARPVTRLGKAGAAWVDTQASGPRDGVLVGVFRPRALRRLSG